MFSLPPGLDTATIELWGLVVTKRTETEGHTVDHTVWRVEGRRSPSGHLPSVKWPIKYGAEFAHMDQLVAAVPLSPGHYVFDASILVRRGAEPAQQSTPMMPTTTFSLNAQMRLE